MLEMPLSWTTLFVGSCYLMGLACLWRCLRVGNEAGWSLALRELAVFLLFCGLGYGVESWAHSRTPYYLYWQAFPDRVPRIPFDSYAWFTHLFLPPSHPCSDLVMARMKDLGGREIPLCIPIFEGSLAYAALWTSRFLCAPLWFRPLLAGLTLFNADALLDPIVATTHDCTGLVTRQGLGFWHWYIDDSYIAHWYGIPLFNFVGWFGAAVLLVSLAYLLGWGGEGVRRLTPSLLRAWPAVPLPSWRRATLWLLAVLGPGLVIAISPSLRQPPSKCSQWLVTIAELAVAVALTIRAAPRFHTGERPVWDVPLALILPVLFSIAALLRSGQFLHMPTFLIVAVVTSALGVLLALWPYRDAILRLAQRLIDIDRFIRLHYLAYPWLLILLGLALVPQGHVNGETIGAALIIGLGFQIYACVLNDVLDLAIDRTQVRRQRDPLVRGAIGPDRARSIALIQLPIIGVAAFVASGALQPVLLLALACALMGAYNRWGKRCPVPPVTDIAQGAAWGLLALVGASIAGRLGALSWIVFLYGAGFMSLINGVHGGLRDLANDVAHQRRNTAAFLGAKPIGQDATAATSTPRIAAFAFTIQTIMLLPLAAVLWLDALPYHAPISGTLLPVEAPLHWWMHTGAVIAFLAVAVWCHVLLARLVRPSGMQRDAFGSMHAFAILLPPLIVFTPGLDPVMQVIVPLAFFLPLLVQFVEPFLGGIFPALRGELSSVPPAGCRG